MILLIASFLSGCMYPDAELEKNQVPYQDQIDSVQRAVNQFQQDNGGILPIKTKDATTPIYQKYPIDFQRVVPKYLAEPPGNSFENGGIFQYVILDAETKPTVKLIDLRIAEKIRDIKIRLQTQQYPPFDKEIAKNVYTLNFKKLGYKETPFVVSPYTNQNLSFVIDGQGEVYVDYRSDLFAEISKSKRDLKPGEDIRFILAEKSMIVPAFSLPYTIDLETNEPVFLSK
ncbi:hypothetical protein [Bacillus sp. cl95]|uniref:hypothetical protein n=2 Tax=unclassified Bacillus (in: firmicutes) TaxID=185979 RepID=UPI0020C836CE|nr:hypothetical protein [Bacillus sp. cl95]